MRQQQQPHAADTALAYNARERNRVTQTGNYEIRKTIYSRPRFLSRVKSSRACASSKRCWRRKRK
jgi:hypothetical protein